MNSASGEPVVASHAVAFVRGVVGVAKIAGLISRKPYDTHFSDED